jgi:hypothetical protein
VTFSAVTTAILFVPLLFWPGIMGEFMWYLPVTVILAIFTSLFVAMVINPALSAFFIRLPFGHGADPVQRIHRMVVFLGQRRLLWSGFFNYVDVDCRPGPLFPEPERDPGLQPRKEMAAFQVLEPFLQADRD